MTSEFEKAVEAGAIEAAAGMGCAWALLTPVEQYRWKLRAAATLRAALPILDAEFERIAAVAVSALRNGGASDDGQAGATAMANTLRAALAKMLEE